jgi:Zn-dependent protease
VNWSLFVPMVLAYLVSLSWHESAHAWTAWKLGDSTGRALGRISLNPLVHLDPFGSVLLPLMMWFTTGTMFGYAKPVPYNPYALRNGPIGSSMVAGAGPVSNLLLAVLSALALGFLAATGAGRFEMGERFLFDLVVVNVILAVFNLIPLPPLDGGTVVTGLLPRRAAYVIERNQMVAFVLLVVLMMTGVLSSVVHSVSRAIIQPLLFLTGAGA